VQGYTGKGVVQVYRSSTRLQASRECSQGYRSSIGVHEYRNSTGHQGYRSSTEVLEQYSGTEVAQAYRGIRAYPSSVQLYRRTTGVHWVQ